MRGEEARGEVEVPPPSGEIGSNVGDEWKQDEVISYCVLFSFVFVS